MSMVRVAQGNPIMLFPVGAISSVEEISADMMNAISHVNLVSSWSENLSREEQPPRWMWPFPDELSIWFQEVEIAREKKYGSSGNSDEEDLAQNELAR